jgi:bifunctional non-homologous end joining protein LigD
MKAALKTYRAKRDFAITPEPAGGGEAAGAALAFVIQKHWASRLHYDFRLELDGTMKSWAVPKGPSYDPRDRRMACRWKTIPCPTRPLKARFPKTVWRGQGHHLGQGYVAAAAGHAGRAQGAGGGRAETDPAWPQDARQVGARAHEGQGRKAARLVADQGKTTMPGRRWHFLSSTSSLTASGQAHAQAREEGGAGGSAGRQLPASLSPQLATSMRRRRRRKTGLR